MSNTRSEFEKYFKENHADSFYSVHAALKIRGDAYIYFHAADLWAVWQHQQSKIDKLQANFDQHDQWLGQRNRDVRELSDIIAKHAADKDELQKRVDALIQKYKDEDRELKLIDEWEKSQIYGLVASELEQVLKGESNG